ncbi:hypothetical protein MY3296_010091 [Beauveria thailandica]
MSIHLQPTQVHLPLMDDAKRPRALSRKRLLNRLSQRNFREMRKRRIEHAEAELSALKKETETVKGRLMAEQESLCSSLGQKAERVAAWREIYMAVAENNFQAIFSYAAHSLEAYVALRRHHPREGADLTLMEASPLPCFAPCLGPSRPGLTMTAGDEAPRTPDTSSGTIMPPTPASFACTTPVPEAVMSSSSPLAFVGSEPLPWNKMHADGYAFLPALPGGNLSTFAAVSGR